MALLADGRIGHIVIADSADAIVVAPATAHWLGAMANGLAADVVTAACLATSAPVVVAPAMDGEMYAHPATRANMARLRDASATRSSSRRPGRWPRARRASAGWPSWARSSTRWSPRSAGRPVRAPDARATGRRSWPADRAADLEGRHMIVTAGGTREAIDPVRFIGNRSSGRMGVAIAQAALDRGARVSLIAAASRSPCPRPPRSAGSRARPSSSEPWPDCFGRGASNGRPSTP